MLVIGINSGSSSLKYQVRDVAAGIVLTEGLLEKRGLGHGGDGAGEIGGPRGHDPGLGGRSAASVQPAVPFDGGKRLCFPQRRISGRLDIVVGVQQDSRLPCRRLATCDDGRAAGAAVVLITAQDLVILHAGSA